MIERRFGLLTLAALLLIFGCSGSDDPPPSAGSGCDGTGIDSFTINATTFTEQESQAASEGCDPFIAAEFETISSTNNIFIIKDWNGTDFDFELDIDVPGTAPGTGIIPAAVTYQTPPFNDCRTPTTGTVDITTYGPVGGRIVGTFTNIGGWVFIVGTCSGTVSGAFDITRVPDDSIN